MLRNLLYYNFKPYLPLRMRMFMRRWHAARLLPKVKDVWPINEAAGKKPEGWPGWPDGKQFAVVLTHDVEGRLGLERVRQLAELEMKYGFRSSFNFIPEGEYRVSSDLRSWLVAQGFEVGVHDLYHDGKLYRNREHFREHAEKINQYLKDWGAVGFRSGFMHRNLEWIHDLNIQYDASTFDTDPFEPQPDGAGTIFPFWVPFAVDRQQSTVDSSPSPVPCPLSTVHRPPSTGYVELPYTLPQDSTLFLFLGEKNIEIWKRKIAWIAQRGGMVLLNTHPDYMSVSNGHAVDGEYPVKHYEELLKHLRDIYKENFWAATPAKVAAYCTPFKPKSPPAHIRRVAMISHSFYESDNRVMRYAESLAERGDSVEVFCLKKSSEDPNETTIAGVKAIRVQLRQGKKEQTKFDYLWPVLRFWLRAAWAIGRRNIQKRYDLVHVHNLPDFIVFAALLPKLTGAKIILDIHDIVPEFFMSKFKTSEKTATIKALFAIERASARFAHHVIISNHLWHEKYATRTSANGKCSVFINNVDSHIYHQRSRTRKDNKQIIIFPGGLQWHQGLDIAIRAFALITGRLPDAEFHIYGDGNKKAELIELTKELGLQQKVLFFNVLSLRQIAEVMANADLGVVPKRADSFGNEAYSTKIMEFMSLGVPVVISRTKIDTYYFNDTVARFFESGNHEELASAMIEVLTNPELRNRLTTNALAYVRQNNWEARKADYLKLVDDLMNTP